LPTLASVNPNYDAVSGQWEIVMQGSGFPTDASTVKLEVDGVAQTTKSITTGSTGIATFAIIDVKNATMTNIKVTFA
jgi:hypothetical protein